MAGQRRPGYRGLLSPFLKDILRWHKQGASTREIARRINGRDSNVRIGSRHVYYVLRRAGVLVMQPTGPIPPPPPRERPAKRKNDPWESVTFLRR